MHPEALAQLLMAAHGHAGLPQTLTAPGGPGPMGPGGPGGPPPMGPGGPMGSPPGAAPMDASAGPSGGDRHLAESAAQQLLSAAHNAHDPALKVAFSSALNALHKYILSDDKEHQQAMSGKMSPKIMARAAL